MDGRGGSAEEAPSAVPVSLDVMVAQVADAEPNPDTYKECSQMYMSSAYAREGSVHRPFCLYSVGVSDPTDGSDRGAAVSCFTVIPW